MHSFSCSNCIATSGSIGFIKISDTVVIYWGTRSVTRLGDFDIFGDFSALVCDYFWGKSSPNLSKILGNFLNGATLFATLATLI